MCDTTVDVERFAGLNIRGFSLWSFSWKYFHGALATSVHYLPKVKNSQENFRGKLKNHGNGKRLAQWIFSCLRNNFIKLDIINIEVAHRFSDNQGSSVLYYIIKYDST